MALFPTLEWLEALKEVLNASEDYRASGKDWEGALTLVCEPDETFDRHVYMWIDPYHGQVREVAEMQSADERQSDFRLISNYSTWKSIVKGELEPIKAMMKGKVAVEGDMSILIKQVKSAQALMKGLKQVQTEFMDEQ